MWLWLLSFSFLVNHLHCDKTRKKMFHSNLITSFCVHLSLESECWKGRLCMNVSHFECGRILSKVMNLSFHFRVTAEKNANWFLFWGGWGQTIRLYSYFNFWSLKRFQALYISVWSYGWYEINSTLIISAFIWLLLYKVQECNPITWM